MGFKSSNVHNSWTDVEKYGESEVIFACVHSHHMCHVVLEVWSCINAKPS